MIRCEDCKKREAVLTFSNEPMFAMTHGWGKIEICRQCLIKRIVEHIEQCKRQLKKEKRLLKKEISG